MAKKIKPDTAEKIRNIWNTICVVVNAILAAICTSACVGL